MDWGIFGASLAASDSYTDVGIDTNQGLAEEEEEEEAGERAGAEAEAGEGVMEEAFCCVKVMTDEQTEVLRRQIAAYAAICEQLVEMHRAQYDSLAGMRMGNLYDPLMYGGHKITARQRWTPTPMQLQILEDLFGKGNGTPSKQQIKEITSELSQHGKITETNVYNWFQNRRARSKRKQTASSLDNASEAEAEVESLTERRANSEIIQFQGTERLYDVRGPKVSSEVHSLDPDSYIQTPRMDHQFFQCPEASSEESAP